MNRARLVRLLLPALLLAGCSAPADAESPQPKTCEEYMALDEAAREDAANRLLPDSIAAFSGDGATLAQPMEWLDERCAEESAAATLRSLQPEFPPCDSYLALAAGVQLDWSTVFWSAWKSSHNWEPGPDDQVAATMLVRACEMMMGDGATPTLDEVGQFMSDADPATLYALATGNAAPPPTTALAGLRQTFSVVDADGYTMNVAIAYQPTEYTSNAASENPGFTAITSRFQLTVTVSNTTPSRDITFAGLNGTLSEPFLSLYAVFAAGNPVCTSVGISGACAYLISSGELVRTLPAGGSTTVEMVRGSLYGIEPGVAHVPEGQADAVLAAIARPDGFRLTYAADDFRRFPELCAITGTVGGFITTGICDEAAPLKQPGQS